VTKPLLKALGGETAFPPPMWLMRQAGRYLPEYRKLRTRAKTFLEFCYTPELATEAALQPLRRYGLDAAILFSDILVIPDALGQSVAFEEGKGPVLEPIRNARDIAKLSRDAVAEHLEPVFQTLRNLSQALPEKTALIGFAGAPWTVAVYMVEGQGGTDCSRIKSWAAENVEEFQKLIDILVDATAAYLILQAKNGAEALQLFDSWAGILDETLFRRLVIEPTRKIVARVREAAPGTPIIGFPRMAGALYEPYVMKTKVDGVSLDADVPLEWARDTLQPLCAVQGNLDNQALFEGGGRLDRETGRILEVLGDGPFVFNLGHGVLQGTPPEHVARLCDVVRSWERTPAEGG